MTAEASPEGRPADESGRYKDGDRQAFESLWLRHCEDFRPWLRRRLEGDEHAVEDLLQDAAAKLLTPPVRASYDSSQEWGPWAFRVLQRLALDFFRRRARRECLP